MQWHAPRTAAPLALIEVSGDLGDPVIAEWSCGAELLFGYTAAEVVGRSLAGALAGPGDLEGFRPLAGDEGGAPHRCECARKDGSRVVVEWIKKRVRDEHGQKTRALYVGQDISARSEEAKLREERLLLRAVLENLSITVCRFDREGVITFQEGKGLSVIGMKPGQLVGANVHVLYASHREGAEGILQALAGNASHSVYEVRGTAWETWHIPVRDDRGKPDGMINITLDASDASRRELELRAKLELIERQQKVIRDLSTPIIEVWDKVLTLPMVGVVDSLRIAEVMDNLLQAVVNKDARFAILDLTGVDAVDTRTAGYLIELIKAIRLLGAEGIITGIRSNVAQTMIALGLDLSGVTTVGNLRAGLKLCMRRMAAAGEAGAAGGAPAK
ncbi:PAS domain S-box protein [Sorangium sp. So ce1078]|uniref:PAS domain S-box protein n=1 Tax=Sorangium sp. So ce1078 TaxID=3133329 RepID=UPI003F6068A6